MRKADHRARRIAVYPFDATDYECKPYQLCFQIGGIFELACHSYSCLVVRERKCCSLLVASARSGKSVVGNNKVLAKDFAFDALPLPLSSSVDFDLANVVTPFEKALFVNLLLEVDRA